MNYSYFTKERTLILCAFLLCSCTGENNSINKPNKQSSAAQLEETSNKQAIPLLSLQELLQASDLKLALAQAAKEDDQEVFEFWQKSLLKVADEVNLLASERQLIEGKQGLVFLEFQGMKTNYKAEFEHAFFEFGDINAVYAKYPAFKNAHAQSKELVKKRDELINKVAEELKQQGFEGESKQEARLQWQNYTSQELRTELIK